MDVSQMRRTAGFTFGELKAVRKIRVAGKRLVSLVGGGVYRSCHRAIALAKRLISGRAPKVDRETGPDNQEIGNYGTRRSCESNLIHTVTQNRLQRARKVKVEIAECCATIESVLRRRLVQIEQQRHEPPFEFIVEIGKMTQEASQIPSSGWD